MASRLILLVLIIARYCSADSTDPTPDQWCVYGCDQALDYNSFAGQPNATDGYYLAECQNYLQVSSFWACARKYCSHSEFNAGYQWKSTYCLTWGGINVLPPSIISNLTDEDIDNLPLLNFGSVDIVNATSLPDKTTFDLAYRTGAEYYTQVMHHMAYSRAMFIFWGIVIGIGVFFNGFHHFGLSNSVHSHIWWTKLKGLFVIAPYTAFQGDGSRPPLVETLINMIFLSLNIVLCAVNYTAFEGNIFWPSTSLQTWRYLADRCGYLAYSNLSIFWLFGIRNNILIWLTGWPFATFSRFHRMVAFISTVEAIVHGISYSAFSYVDGGNAEYLENFSEQYWNVGVVALVTMSLAVCFSVTWLRVRWYDFFLVVHIIFALITLVMLFYHTIIFLGEFDGYLWPCVAFWAFDRLVRVGRVIWNLATAKSTKCMIEYDQDADIVRVDMTNALGRWRREEIDGDHYYMYMLKSIRCWESHPFTLVCWKDEETVWRYSFLIRPYDGFTRTLAKHALRSPITRSCLFEGPYGTTIAPDKNLSSFTEILYIIGGSGISVAISSLYCLLESTETGPELKIKLIWTIRNQAFLTSVMDRELRKVKSRIDVEAYITRDSRSSLQSQEEKSLEDKKLEVNNDGYVVAHERLDIRRCILDAARDTRGTVRVITCGPVGMMNDVRKAVVEANGDGVERIKLFAEDFSW